jgi:hypothetical protein
MRNEAIIKSVHFKTFPDNELPSLAEMAAYPTARKNKFPFIGVNLNMGTTSYWSTNPSVIKKQQYSFGRPITFFRFSFTAALYDTSGRRSRCFTMTMWVCVMWSSWVCVVGWTWWVVMMFGVEI